MDILVRGDKIKVTKAINDYIKEKLSKLDKYIEDSNSIKATVVINVKNHSQKVEITIPLKTVMLRAEESQEDLYAAIDIIVDKIERQLRKNKTKLQSKKIKDTFPKDLILDYIEDYDEDNEPSIVKRKKIEIKPMSEEEAIIQMELIGHQFFLFKDADTMAPTVVYKRKDGNYGLIESE